MTTAKADCEALLNSVLLFAKQMLGRHGEFHPYGGAMLANGELASVATYDGHEHPSSKDVIRQLKSGFVAAARSGEYKATAIVYDVRITLPSNREKSDAIAVALDHRDNYSLILMFPYRIDSGNPVIASPIAQKGEADIFG